MNLFIDRKHNFFTAHEDTNLGIIQELDLSRAGELDSDYGFRDFTDLTKLTLKNNKISLIKNEWFDAYNNIKYLDVSYNEMTTIRREAVRQLVKVTHLNLSRNEIANIQTNAFADLTKLEELDLHYNDLRAFSNIGLSSTLKTLDLTDNSLTSVRNL